MQQGDVKLIQTNDDGDILVADGVVEMTSGFETAAYLALFGGNEQDDGLEGNPFGWWGNIGENVAARKYVSETQNLLQSLPLTTGNLKRIEDAAGRDLSFFLSQGIASSVTIAATIPAVNTVRLSVSIIADGEESEFSFTENWKAAS